ncbi:extensin-like [Haliotis rufescens]|uniref:extensin-like n=1 Tax=Haliotis rufescens TaxID=6454 RepID=UPI00201E95DE|nr:extensin-like [Haliotis rufescens]
MAMNRTFNPLTHSPVKTPTTLPHRTTFVSHARTPILSPTAQPRHQPRSYSAQPSPATPGHQSSHLQPSHVINHALTAHSHRQPRQAINPLTHSPATSSTTLLQRTAIASHARPSILSPPAQPRHQPRSYRAQPSPATPGHQPSHPQPSHVINHALTAHSHRQPRQAINPLTNSPATSSTTLLQRTAIASHARPSTLSPTAHV